VAFRYADPKKDIPRYLSEINKIGGIKVLPPDVNVSTESMGTDFENSSIHFGLVDIKFTGEGAANQIVEERSRNGEFVSLEDFVDRHIYKGSKVTKRNVEGLILSGAFDTLESVNLPSERHALLVKYYAIADVKVDEKNKYREKKKDWWWTLVQKEFSGIAFFDYPSLARNNLSRVKFGADLITGEKLHKEVNCVIGGFVTDVDFRKGKRGEYAKVYLEMNYEFIAVTIWTDSLKANRDEVANSKGGLMLISGTAKFDSYQKRNMLHSNDGTKIKVLK